MVITASSAQEAHETLRDATFDVLVVDLRMPDEDGPSFARAMQRAPSLRTIPLLAITANHELYEPRALHAVGFVEVLRKPFVFPELVEAIARVVPAKPDR